MNSLVKLNLTCRLVVMNFRPTCPIRDLDERLTLNIDGDLWLYSTRHEVHASSTPPETLLKIIIIKINVQTQIYY